MSESETLYGDNMENIRDQQENVECGKWYHVRVDKVKTHDDQGEQLKSGTGGAKCQVTLKVQDEGPYTGKVIVMQPSLQPQALFTLKALYNAGGYRPGPGGHNPHRLLNTEFYVKPTSKMYEGQERVEVQSYNIKPLSEGRPIK